MADAAPVASLPMYDWPEVAWATDALWEAIADRLRRSGIAAPLVLDRSRSSDDVWRDPALVLSQTCGYPFSTRLRGVARLVGTPIYAVPGCEGAHYSSMVVVRSDDPASQLANVRGRRFAYNTDDSLSGYLALIAAMKEADVAVDSSAWIETGSHRASLRAVAEDRADVAAIDAVCWAFAQRYEPNAATRLKVIERTSLRPGLPLITAIGRPDGDVRAIRNAITEALDGPALHAAREVLHLGRLGTFAESDYAPIADLGR